MTYKIKTRKTTESVSRYLNVIDHEERKKDAKEVHALMKEITKERPRLWGNSIVGFGSYKYRSKSGCEGEWPLVGYSARKQQLVVYIMPGFKEYKALLKKLGSHTHSVSCLYIKHLSDIHIPTLKKLIRDSYKVMKKRYNT